MATSLNPSQGSNPKLPIRIAAFGHRGVGKSTYLTALYAMLVNNTYRGVGFEYTDDDTAAKLSEYLNTVAENYSATKDWQLPPTVALPQELQFLLQRKGQEYNLSLIDYRGESTTVGEMTQNKDLLDFFATCDGLMIFNANEADETDLTARRANHLARHQDMKYLFSSLKKRAGQKKLRVPVAMVYTKSDKIDFGALTPEDWVEEKNSALLDTFRDNVEVFRTVFLSSQTAFSNVMKDDRFKLTETERTSDVVKCDTDVAYPLFWLIDQIQPPYQVQAAPQSYSSKKWWIFPVVFFLLVGATAIWRSQIKSSQVAISISQPELAVPVTIQQVVATQPAANTDLSSNPSFFVADFNGVIDDVDGFTNVRINGNKNSEILGQMMVGEPFEVQKNNSNWWKIKGKENPVEGFMQKDHIKMMKIGNLLPGRFYKGANGPHPISVYLEDGKQIDCDRGGHGIVGYYFYDKSGSRSKIRLKGYICGESVSLEEFNKNDEAIATFSGILGGDAMQGKWNSVGKEFEFSLNQVESLAAKNGIQNEQTTQTTHLVLPSRAYFYDYKAGNYISRPNVYVVQGDKINVISTNDNFHFAEYINTSGVITKGFLSKNDLKSIQ